MNEEIYESKELLKQNVDVTNPEQVLKLVKDVLNTEDDTKMKLFVIGEVLTKNKNDVIYQLKGDVTRLNKRISNQRLYINKLKKALAVSEAKVKEKNNQINNISDKIDREAYKKACNSFDNTYPTKKKVIVRKKSYSK